jgi:hypothetical protein
MVLHCNGVAIEYLFILPQYRRHRSLNCHPFAHIYSVLLAPYK